MSLPTAILTLTPLTPLTPLFGRKGALLGGEGEGEGTPRVHGQGTGPLEPISSKRRVRAALPFLQGTRASYVEERVRSHEQGLRTAPGQPDRRPRRGSGGPPHSASCRDRPLAI